MEATFLTSLGIPEDVAATVLAQVATETTAAVAAVQEQLDTANTQLAEAGEQIEAFRGMGIDEIKAAADDYKAKFEAAEAEKATMQHQHKLEGFVKALGLRDDIYEAHVTKQLTDAGLQFDGDKLIGGDDVVAQFRETHPDAFVPGGDPPRFAAPSSHAAGALDGVEAAFYAKNPDLQ